VTAPVIVPIVDDLEALELIERERNARDRRSYALRLTDAGGAKLDTARAEVDALTAKLIGRRDREELAALLRRLIEDVDLAEQPEP
jgi:DNA-binding MarR family transcriptional regulator